ncbi:hypothetical protein JNK13_09525 [bacterium]|nr:hypothetical protein [bacterium]
MSSAYTKLDQALADLIEAYVGLESDMETKFSDDADAFQSAMTETLETAIETALEEQDASTSTFATMLSLLSEALETLDPSAFDEETEEAADEDEDYDDDEDIDIDEDEEDLELDEDEEEEEDD